MENCSCVACVRHSRAYLRHLFMVGEMLGPILLSVHNLTYYHRLVGEAREAIRRGQYQAFMQARMSRWATDGSVGSDGSDGSV
jgi:queuine tRNA-ribosyltransferase